MRIHIDTDIAGDPDDACALAMVLGWPGVELCAITTNLDAGGYRAGAARRYLELAGRAETPVAPGAGASLTTLVQFRSFAEDRRYWPDRLPDPCPARPGAAPALLYDSIEAGAAIVAIGAATNLALLEIERPGTLARASVVMMGGYVDAPGAGLPAFSAADDWNVQCDTRALEILFAAAGELTLSTLPVCARSHLRAAHLPRLHGASALGALLAAQCQTWAKDTGKRELGRSHAGLPDDLINFHWDPVTCALAAGWDGARIAEQRLSVALDGGVLRFERSLTGRPVRVLEDLDAEDFAERFLACVERAGRADAGHPQA